MYVVNGVPLKGKLDKLEFDGKDVNVVDYKTGDPDKAKDKLQAAVMIKIQMVATTGGRLYFIKFLLDNYDQETG